MSRQMFLSGKPGVGKTTIFQKVISEFQDKCVGFYTKEIRDGDKRVGFDVITINLSYENGPLAHVDFKTDYQLGRYGVDIDYLEKILPALYDQMGKSKFFIIDEIGTMEAFSQPFKQFIEDLLASNETILATIKMEQDDWHDKIKQEFDGPQLIATIENRDTLAEEIIRYFK